MSVDLRPLASVSAPEEPPPSPPSASTVAASDRMPPPEPPPDEPPPFLRFEWLQSCTLFQVVWKKRLPFFELPGMIPRGSGADLKIFVTLFPKANYLLSPKVYNTPR